jgi:hypothetical protein
MKSARPADRDLVRREAGIVESWLIKEIGDSVRPGTPDQRWDCVDNQSKAIFGFSDFVNGLL